MKDLNKIKEELNNKTFLQFEIYEFSNDEQNIRADIKGKIIYNIDIFQIFEICQENELLIWIGNNIINIHPKY